MQLNVWLCLAGSVCFYDELLHLFCESRRIIWNVGENIYVCRSHCKIPFCLVLVPPAPGKKFCAELLPPPFGAKREEPRKGFYPNRGKRAAIDCRRFSKNRDETALNIHTKWHFLRKIAKSDLCLMSRVGRKSGVFPFSPRFPDFVSGRIWYTERVYVKPRLCGYAKSRGDIDKPLNAQWLYGATPLAVAGDKGGYKVL